MQTTHSDNPITKERRDRFLSRRERHRDAGARARPGTSRSR